MIARILLVAVVAGALAGVFAHGAQMLKVTPLIHQAEAFEDGAHAAHAAPAGEAAGDAGGWAPAPGLERHGLTLLANVLTGVAFGFLLTAAIAARGRDVGARECVVWGVAGFAVFSLAPAIGLPPELPGSQAADVGARQLWWVGTVAATAAGLAAVAFARPGVLKAAGVALVVLPHAIGAPHPHGLESTALPAELAARFAVVSLATALAFWIVLAVLTGHLYQRWVAQR